MATITPKKFKDVFQAELDAIRARRSRNNLAVPNAVDAPTTQCGLIGLALSGGGVRSASFALGVLQALSASDLIKRIDYLSTVSGGGYIGTAMIVAMSANGGKFPFVKEGTDSDETPETRHLRDNSRYLIQNGLPSVLSAAAAYLRGIAMNLLVVLPIVLLSALALIWSHELLRVLKVLVLPDEWNGTFLYSAALSILIGIVFAVVWSGYAIAVSVRPARELPARQKLSRRMSFVMLAAMSLSLLEVHAWLLDVSLVDAFLYAEKVGLSLSTLALAALPFVKSLASLATKGTEDAGWSDVAKRLLSSVMLFLIAAIVPLCLWLSIMILAQLGLPLLCDGWRTTVTLFGCPAIVLIVVWQFLSVNANSLHQLYRDRLASAFLVQQEQAGKGDERTNVVKQYSMRAPSGEQTLIDLVSADDFLLSEIKPECTPYHLINVALNVPGSKFANMRGRNADFFMFSPRFIGSELTNYVATELAEKVIHRLNIGTAMAVSGAAIAPNMGMASLKPLSPTIAFFNLRLGRWLQHPRWIARRAWEMKRGRRWERCRQWRFRYPRPSYLLREAFSKTDVNLGRQKADKVQGRGFLFLTDGGHIENLGVYELLRRRCKVIIAVDGEADPRIACHSLVQLERFARIDLNTRIKIDWQPIGKRTREVGQLVKTRTVSYADGPHVALGLIEYPALSSKRDRERGLLVYIKASLSGDENDYVMNYKARNPSFPHETTADQIFSEEQLEVYRALGEHIAKRFLAGDDCASAFTEDCAKIIPLADPILPMVTDRLRRNIVPATRQRSTVHPPAVLA